MGRTITLNIRGIPPSKQSARIIPVYNRNGEPVIVEKNGRKRVLTRSYQKRSVVKAEENIRVQILAQLPPDWEPIDGPIVVDECIYAFPALRSFSKRKMQELRDGAVIYKPTKPDLHDNLSKALFDAMEGIVFTNDAKIVEMNKVRKVYSVTPGITITLREVDE